MTVGELIAELRTHKYDNEVYICRPENDQEVSYVQVTTWPIGDVTLIFGKETEYEPKSKIP